MTETMDKYGEQSNLEDFLNPIFGEEDQEAQVFINTFNAESQRYKDEGFDDYVLNTTSLSSSLQSKLIEFKDSLEELVLESQPNLQEYQSFISDSRDQFNSSELCAEDKKIASDFLTLNLGHAQYIYQNFYKAEYSDSSDVDNTANLEIRDCNNFWKKLLCGALGVIVGTVTAVAIAWILATIPISVVVVYAAGSVLPGGGIALEETTVEITEGVLADSCPECAVLIAAVIGIYVGVNMTKWCCSWFDKDDDQVCEDPDGAYYRQTNCDEFEYVIFGPSTYTTTNWMNENTDPAIATTPRSRLKFSVPDFGNLSEMIANTTCVQNSSTVFNYPWDEDELFESEDDLFPLEWALAPPADWDYLDGPESMFDNTFRASVNTPQTDVYDYIWTINSPHRIVGGGTDSNYADVWIAAQNINVNITCTAEDLCLNQSDMISGTTIVQ